MVKTPSWKDIMESDITQLTKYCKKFGLPQRGDEDNIRERLLRHVFSITLPSGEIYFQGKININKATPQEMSMWPFMGDTLIRNIMNYRKKYGRFYKVEDLLNVKGVGPNLFKKLVQFIDVAGKTRIKLLQDIKIDKNLELIRLEDDIRQKAWELMDLKETKDLEIETLGDLITEMGKKDSLLKKGIKDLERSQKQLQSKEKELGKLRTTMEKEMTSLVDMEREKQVELDKLKKQEILLEEILPWRFILESNEEELKKYCEQYGLSTRGDRAGLRDRLIRHVLKITLPVGEILLEGKVNINTASPDEMRMWPLMGDTLIHNIIDYREKYGRLYKVEDLLNVKGVGPNLLKKLVQFVDVSGSTHIKIKKGIRVDTDMELLKLEDEIRTNAWELKDLRDTMELDIDYVGELVTGMESKGEQLSLELVEIEKFKSGMKTSVKKLEELRKGMEKHFESLEGIQRRKEEELEKLKEQEIVLEEILPWRFILESEEEQLRAKCEDFGLSTTGDRPSLRDRLIRHVLKISLPVGDVFFEGKLNINTASSEEMKLWPYMGNTLVKNIMDYRTKYNRFNDVEDLLNVKGVGPNLFKKLVQFVDISGNTKIKIKKGIRGEAVIELLKLEDDIRNKAWELQDLKDRIEMDIEYLIEVLKGMDKEKQTVIDKLGDVEELQTIIMVQEKELQLKGKELTEMEEHLNEIAYGLGASPEDMDIETVDLPVIVPRDPDDTNPEDDTVMVNSSDGYIRRVINVFNEGVKLDDDNSKVIFKDLPVGKSYDVYVDTGERRYCLIKNFSPGGEI